MVQWLQVAPLVILSVVAASADNKLGVVYDVDVLNFGGANGEVNGGKETAPGAKKELDSLWVKSELAATVEKKQPAQSAPAAVKTEASLVAATINAPPVTTKTDVSQVADAPPVAAKNDAAISQPPVTATTDAPRVSATTSATPVTGTPKKNEAATKDDTSDQTKLVAGSKVLCSACDDVDLIYFHLDE